MAKLFRILTISDDVSSSIYKRGDKAIAAYFFRKLFPNTVVLARTNDIENIRKVTKVEDNKVWFSDLTQPQKSVGPYDKACVRAVLFVRYRPRNNR